MISKIAKLIAPTSALLLVACNPNSSAFQNSDFFGPSRAEGSLGKAIGTFGGELRIAQTFDPIDPKAPIKVSFQLKSCSGLDQIVTTKIPWNSQKSDTDLTPVLAAFGLTDEDFRMNKTMYFVGTYNANRELEVEPVTSADFHLSK